MYARKQKRKYDYRKPVIVISQTFLMNFADPFIHTKSGIRYIIAAFEHLSRWVRADAAPLQTVDADITFFNAGIVQQFGSSTIFLERL